MSQKRAEGTRNALLFLSNLGVIQAMPTMFINLFLWPCFFMPLQYFSSQACFHQFISRDHRARAGYLHVHTPQTWFIHGDTPRYGLSRNV